MNDHIRYMQLALRLARRQLGQTWPNPSVGAVVVKDGQIIATGVTQRGGRPHAETQALMLAGKAAQDATLYVSLEPCSHQGKTAPCTDAIISSGIRVVVVGCKDTNPLISGRGIALLKAAGLTVVEGICEAEARALNAGFFSVIEHKRPFIAVKIATSLDGRIASSGGESKWITSEASRQWGWWIRGQYDAVATGGGTLAADDPELTCRLPGLEQHSPVRVIFDQQNRLHSRHKLALSAKTSPVWAFSGENHPEKAVLEGMGVKFLPYSGEHSPQQLTEAVELLAQQGITRLLVEGGAGITTAFLQSGLVDRMYWFRAPLLLGNAALAGIGGGFPASLADATRWTLVERHSIGSDQLDIFACSPGSSPISAP